MKTKKFGVWVTYWVGTIQHRDFATNYRRAMALADRTQNAHQATYEDSDGRQLFDDGRGLAYADVTGPIREYAV